MKTKLSVRKNKTQKCLPLDLRIKIYKISRKLKFEGLTYKEISDILSIEFGIKIPRDTTYRWVKYRNKPDGTFNKFISKPSQELSYVIGVFLGDGCLRTQADNYEYAIRLKVKDKEFAEEFSRALAKILNKGKPYSVGKENDFTRGNRIRYRAQASSKLLSNFLSKPLGNLLFYVNPFYVEFLRGLFDSDGFTAISAKEKFNVGIGLVGTDLKILKFVRQILKENFEITCNISPTIKPDRKVIIWGKVYTAKKTVYSLMINKFEDVIKFYKNVGFSIKRKQEKIKDAIDLKQKFASEEAVKKWRQIYTKSEREWVKINPDSGDSPELSSR